MTQNVLTINECFSDNLGDQAIAHSLKTLLENEGIDVTLSDFTGNRISSSIPNKAKKSLIKNIIIYIKQIELLRITWWCCKNVFRIKRAIKSDIDFAIIGGGQLILSNSTFPIALYIWTLLLKRYKKDIYLFAVGSGDTFTAFNSYLIKVSLGRIKRVYVRDVSSQYKIKDEFGIKSLVVPDVAYSYPLPEKEEHNRRNGAIVGIVDYNVFTRYAGEVNHKFVNENEYMQLWLREIINKNLNNITLLATTYTDLQISERFYEFIVSQELAVNVSFINRLLTLDEYCQYLTQSECVLSGRMHSLILAERFSCKTIAWPISKKIQAYAAEVENRGEDVIVCKILQSEIHAICSEHFEL